MRQSTIERIEDELDLKTYQERMKRHEKNPKTPTLDEVIERLG